MTLFTEAELSRMSVMERVSMFPPADRDRFLAGLTLGDLKDPELWLRPDQLAAYHDEADTVGQLAGRGAGKTRTGASWCIRKARDMPGSIGHLVARTVSDVRDVMVRGDSGIMQISPPDFMPEYVPSLRLIKWPNGSTALTFSAEKPSQLRGPQSHWTWADELAAWNQRPDDSGANAWDQVRIGTRLGEKPQIFVTTTPKRVAAIKELVRMSKTGSTVSLHYGSTFSNKAHLSPTYLKNLLDLYKGTALERQELYGELLDIVEGALWQANDILVVPDWLHDEPTLSVIAVDPGLTTGGDATGILTVRSTTELALTQRRAAVVADWTEGDLQPERWAARVVEAWRTEKDITGNVPIIVAEKNAGGELVASVIEGVAGENNLPIALVPASRSKAGRAEPIVLAYRQNRVRHLEDMELLVDELTGWEPPIPGGSRGSGWSPNRLDAMVHGLRALLVDDAPLKRFGSLKVDEPGELIEVPRERWQTARGGHGMSMPWRE